MPDPKPLVLDIDGTFIKSDMLFEAFWAGLGKDPIAVVKLSARHFLKPAVLKAKLAKVAEIRTDLLPLQPQVKALADEALAEGREVVLASASDLSQVSRLAQDHGLSERVFASNGGSTSRARQSAMLWSMLLVRGDLTTRETSRPICRFGKLRTGLLWLVIRLQWRIYVIWTTMFRRSL